MRRVEVDSVVDPGVIELEVFYDYQCPFVYRASVLLQNVGLIEPSRLKVSWRYFSLAQVNSKDDGWTVWDAPAPEKVNGRLAFKAAEAARRQERFADLHMPLLQARHRDRLDIDRVDVVERVAVDSGLDLEQFRNDVADPGILGGLARDHQQAVSEHGVFGTPTMVFPNGAAAYVRLVGAPEGPDAIRVLDRLLAVAAGEPTILEIKRPRKPAPD
ncbi:MAG TPA: DsbA family protein [Candidatus Dormibacteraeota bacterium]|nr:DsbA family protein [Candidatus Dormibacteraeota bacterium]